MIVGLTGGIGSGKSTVAKLFAQRGAIIVDTDAIARDVVEPPSRLLDAIRVEFGPEAIDADGRLDRAAVADVVFKDPEKLRRLNEILHPEILKRTLAEIARHPPSSIIIVVVPLLFEANFDRSCDVIAAVVAPSHLRRERTIQRGVAPADVDARMRSQLPAEDYERRARLVIRNDGDLAALEREVDAAWATLQALR